MYRTKEYFERPIEEIKAEIDVVSGSGNSARRVFLADGDALNLPTAHLVEILRHIRLRIRGIERISSYAMPKNLIQKSPDDLAYLKSEGLDMLYVGIESGNDAILRKVTKGATSRSIEEACKKAHASGFVLSCMVILGLGGRTYSNEHISDTAKILGRVSPEYAAALSLQLESPVFSEFIEQFGEPFKPLDDRELLDELARLIKQVEVRTPMIFRANHGSNVYSVGGTIPNERQKMLELVRSVKSQPGVWKPKYLRGF